MVPVIIGAVALSNWTVVAISSGVCAGLVTTLNRMSEARRMKEAAVAEEKRYKEYTAEILRREMEVHDYITQDLQSRLHALRLRVEEAEAEIETEGRRSANTKPHLTLV